jgi:hypothetical protein
MPPRCFLRTSASKCASHAASSASHAAEELGHHLVQAAHGAAETVLENVAHAVDEVEGAVAHAVDKVEGAVAHAVDEVEGAVAHAVDEVEVIARKMEASTRAIYLQERTNMAERRQLAKLAYKEHVQRMRSSLNSMRHRRSWHVINPQTSRVTRVWDVLMALAIMYTAIATPFEVSNTTHPAAPISSSTPP